MTKKYINTITGYEVTERKFRALRLYVSLFLVFYACSWLRLLIVLPIYFCEFILELLIETVIEPVMRKINPCRSISSAGLFFHPIQLHKHLKARLAEIKLVEKE